MNKQCLGPPPREVYSIRGVLFKIMTTPMVRTIEICISISMVQTAIIEYNYRQEQVTA